MLGGKQLSKKNKNEDEKRKNDCVFIEIAVFPKKI